MKIKDCIRLDRDRKGSGPEQRTEVHQKAQCKKSLGQAATPDSEASDRFGCESEV